MYYVNSVYCCLSGSEWLVCLQQLSSSSVTDGLLWSALTHSTPKKQTNKGFTQSVAQVQVLPPAGGSEWQDNLGLILMSCITLQRGLGWHLVTSQWLFNRYEEKPRCSVGFISPRAAHTQQRKLRCGASQVSHDTPARPRGSEGNANVTPAQLCQTNELCCCGVIPSKAHDLWATKTGPQQECIVLHEVGLSLCCLISTDPRASATWQSVSVFTTKRLWHWCIGCQTRRRTNTPHKKCF